MHCSWCVNGYNRFGKLLNNIYIPYGLAILLPGIILNRNVLYVHKKKKYSTIFIQAHFIIAQNKILLKNTSIVEWINKLQDIFTMKYYVTMKINNLQLQATISMVSYKQHRLVKEARYKSIYCIIPFVSSKKKKKERGESNLYC